MLVPCGHRVIIKPDPVEEKSKGGIVVVATEQEERMQKAGNMKGTIISVGPTAWRAFDDGKPWAKEGDRVYYAKYAGKFIVDPETEEEYVICNDEDIVATFSE